MVKYLAPLLLFTTAAIGKWTLPSHSKIVVNAPHMQDGYQEDPTRSCASRHLTEAQLRKKFATYHELKPMELHDKYMVEGCVIEGTITLNQRQFHFIEQPINLLETDYPDGKLHQLGGQHSDTNE